METFTPLPSSLPALMTYDPESMFEVKMILDSINESGDRLSTMTWRYPRFIHSEIMTHRQLSKNSASSRAIPFHKLLAMVTDTPVIPIRFGSEQRGMQTGGEIANPSDARDVWLKARDAAVTEARRLADLGVHKSLCNRLLEPWMWITIVISGTEWENLWRLRCHPDAEIHFQKIAGMAREVMQQSKPTPINYGGWHLPFLTHEDYVDEMFEYRSVDPKDKAEVLRRVSSARCARVSYLTHEGKRDINKDLQLFDTLKNGSGFGHWSPMEHVAEAMPKSNRCGNFVGWLQYRKTFPNECATREK